MKLPMITVDVLIALFCMPVAPTQTSAVPKPDGPVPIPVTAT